ncbi:hypothetical protein GCM10023259_040990 [Thermocatellispora tengchongensis]
MASTSTDFASAATIVPTPTMASTQSRIRRLSRMSASLPTTGVATAPARRTPVKTHAIAGVDAPTAFWINGTAGASTVSRPLYAKVARTSTARTARERLGRGGGNGHGGTLQEFRRNEVDCLSG